MRSLLRLVPGAAAVGLIGVCASVAAVIESLPSVAETSLMEGYPDNNLGKEGYFVAGTIQNLACGTTNAPHACLLRALVKFDIAGAIPAGSRIRSARLRVWVSRAPPNDETDPFDHFDVHRLLVPWGEGTGTNGLDTFPGMLGRAAQPGEATWTHRFAHTTNTWAAPGGAAGIDYVAAISASGGIDASMDENNSPYQFFSTNGLLVADLQFWLDHPGSNYGWMFKARNEQNRWTGKRFMTPESGIDDYPRLEIEYIPPPVIENVLAAGELITFEFLAEEGQPYEVQYRNALTSGGWLTLTNVPAPPFTMPVTVSDSRSSASNRFYRIIAPP